MNGVGVSAPPKTAQAIASVARLLAAARLVDAFGHVSARTESGFAITSAKTPLGNATADSVLLLEGGEVPGGAPLESPLHAAIYAARPDVDAICRTHSPAMVVLGVAGDIPPLTHGLGGMSGAVALADDVQLVTDEARAQAMAHALGDGDCLIMRANGGLAVGESLERAAVRAWFLEERARVWLDSGGRAKPLTEGELAERSGPWQVEAERAWTWLRWRYGDGES